MGILLVATYPQSELTRRQITRPSTLTFDKLTKAFLSYNELLKRKLTTSLIYLTANKAPGNDLYDSSC